MLRIPTGRHYANCEGFTRRDALRVGSLALGGLSLTDLLRSRSKANVTTHKETSVVFLFLSGGSWESGIDGGVKGDASSSGAAACARGQA